MSDDLHEDLKPVWKAIDELRGEARSAYRAAIRVLFAGLGGAVMLGITLALIYADATAQIADVKRENIAQDLVLQSHDKELDDVVETRSQVKRIARVLEWVAQSTQQIARAQKVDLSPMPTGVESP